MKLIIAGSRSIDDKRIFNGIMRYWLFSEFGINFKKPNVGQTISKTIETIISGNAAGVDTFGENFAKTFGIDLIIMPANWDRHGKAAGYKRNEQMAEIADSVLCIWDGKSKGTIHMADIAKKKNLKLWIINSEDFYLGEDKFTVYHKTKKIIEEKQLSI